MRLHARDEDGLTAEQIFTLTVTDATFDRVAPAVTLSIDPDIAMRGESVVISSAATDNLGVMDFALIILFWEFKHLEKAHVVDGGDGYTVTKTFDIAGPYRVMVTGQQFVSGPWGGYTQFVNRSKEFTVAAAPFTVILTPNSK